MFLYIFGVAHNTNSPVLRAYFENNMGKRRTRAAVSELHSSSPKRLRLASGDESSSKPSPRRSSRLAKNRSSRSNIDVIDLSGDCDDDDDEVGVVCDRELVVWHNYWPNEAALERPHHNASLNYAMTRGSDPEDDLDFCWVMPPQHGLSVFVSKIFKRDSQAVVANEPLHSRIIDFMIHYLFASWPASFKDRVFVFHPFIWTLIARLCKNTPSGKDRKTVLNLMRSYSSLFIKQYLIFPILEHNHWQLLIIRDPGKILRLRTLGNGGGGGGDDDDDNDDDDTNTACMVVLDSMNVPYKG